MAAVNGFLELFKYKAVFFKGIYFGQELKILK